MNQSDCRIVDLWLYMTSALIFGQSAWPVQTDERCGTVRIVGKKEEDVSVVLLASNEMKRLVIRENVV